MIIIPANTLSAGGYEVDNSIRFNDGDSPKLTRTFGSSGNQTTWTISMWVKRGVLGTAQPLWSRFQSSAYGTIGTFNSNDTLTFKQWHASSDTGNLTTDRVFRDCSAWYNIIFVWNSGDATAGNRMRLFINGVEETSFSTDTNPSEDLASTWNTAHPMIFGNSESTYFDGYLAEIVFLDGTAVSDGTSFGEFDEDSNIWKPIDVSGLTGGTNGVYLDMEDSSTLGNDAFGGTDWTATNLAAVDQATDTPTNNFPTLNSLAIGSFPVLSEGNLNVRANSDAEYGNIIGTFSTSSSGKWYYEIKVIGKTGTSPWVGLIVDDAPKAGIATNGGANSAGSSSFSAPSFVIQSDGQVTQAGSAGTTYTSFAIGDIISFSIDMDNGACYIAKNGTYMNSGNPASAGSKTGAIITWTAGSVSGFLPAVSVYGASTSSGSFSAVSMNFGSPTFAISSGNTDGDGYGNFEYAVPSDYFSLNTKNLAEYG